ncbi:MAG: Gfo/Idh/MocA family oxidoreductase [Planctomycetota bacterium]|nr:Gfo/Idh/MocA family oxidoreductase [Planctomycetota bacterium]
MKCLKFGMIGGGQGAFIGAVHRTAACLDHGAVFTAGCLSSTPQRALESGRQLGLADSRNYPTWEAMLEGESKLPKGERIDFVSIVTPNHVHFAPALAFTKAGFHVVCDKPLVHTSQQAAQLRDAVAAAGTVFAVTYNYSGYPMVKHARHLMNTGALGEIRKIVVEYNQGWLAGKLEETGQKQADWRTDPARSGLGGAIGDIGSHAEQLTSYITGLEISELCADLTTFVAGRRLDDDASVLLRFKGGAKGVLLASQIELGHENDLRIRVHGTKGTLQWRQEEPNHLVLIPEGGPEQVFRRGNGNLCDAAKAGTRLPPGHPEAFLEAFANVYNNAAKAMLAGEGGIAAAAKHDFPGIIDGARGVAFIERVVESSHSDRKWTSM